MKKVKRNLLFISVMALAIYTSFTLLQIYYNAYIHLFLFGCCLIFAHKRYKFVMPLAIGGLICFIFMLLSMNKTAVSPMGQLGFYLHYITWPVILIAVIDSFTPKQKLILMRTMLIVGIVSSILSLRVLFDDPNISRLLAGAATEEQKFEYYSQGVGGYGTVYATVFLCFGAIYWFINTKSKVDRFLITVYILISILFIIYASYTTAILIVFILTLLALTSKVKPIIKSLAVIAVIALLLLMFWDNISNYAVVFFENLGLDMVVTRLTQLTEASESNAISSLSRSQLYLMSWNSFLENPFAGGNIAGKHSQILDNLAYFGIMGLLMPILFLYYSIKCINLSSKRLYLFYIIFFVLISINTCSVMQIPVSVFFICPLIVNTIREDNNKLNKTN